MMDTDLAPPLKPDPTASTLSHRLPLHIRTPLLLSPILSQRSGCRVALKLDNAQPSGSFKLRGVGTHAVALYEQHGSRTKLVCSSGGNAGLACAYSAKALGVTCTIFVPVTTSANMIARLRTLGAEVVQGGAAWHVADEAARKAVASEEHAVYLHPFDHPAVFEGNATAVEEIAEQLKEAGISEASDAIVCSVGGGGLLSGILRGLEKAGWDTTTAVAVETFGAASLHASLTESYSHNPPKTSLVQLPAITSIATSMGATKVSKTVVDACLARNVNTGGGMKSVRVSDSATVQATLDFLDDHHILAEPSCSASLYPLAEPDILRQILPPAVAARINAPDELSRPLVVVEVCGGSAVTLEKLLEWKTQFAEVSEEINWTVDDQMSFSKAKPGVDEVQGS